MTQQYLDTHYPLSLAKLLSGAANSGKISTPANSDRKWVSQPRSMQDETWEVLTMTFSTPVSVSEINVDILRLNSEYEFWYTNRAGVRLKVNDRSLRHFSGRISTGDLGSFVTISRLIYPVVAVSLELRIRRTYDPLDPTANQLHSLEVRNWLVKRNVYQIEDALQPFERDVDALGNLVERTVRTWSPDRATDNNAETFWKSSPQPTPDAVVSFFMDVRDSDGNAQQIDRFYLDPVYTGQHMNVYYSTDDTVRTRKLSTDTVTPSASTNVAWDKGLGINLTSPTAEYDIDTSAYAFDATKSWWMALTWIPDFDSGNAPGSDLTLATNNGGTFYLRYIVGSNQFRVNYNGMAYNVAGPTSFDSGDELGVVVRVVRSGDISGLPPGIYIHAIHNGVERGSRLPSGGGDTLADLGFSSYIRFQSNYGWLKNFMLKQNSPRSEDYELWRQNPAYYLSPDPVLDDNDPHTPIPATTLDNVLLGNDLSVFEFMRGGLDQYFFTEKVWTPVWANWLVYKGFFYLPVPVYAKYLKFEFTQLTQEPYPIYESGIQVAYKSFPVSVDTTVTSVSGGSNTYQTTTTTSTVIGGATKGKTTSASTTSLIASTSYNYSYTTYNVVLGQGTVSYDIPYLTTQPYTGFATERVSTSNSQQNSFSTSSSKSSTVDTVKIGNNTKTSLMLIAQAFNVTKNAVLIANNLLAHGPKSSIPKAQIAKVAPALDKSGYFILPKAGGVDIRIPTTTVRNTTTSSTTTYYQSSSSSRTRFTNTEVHRYQIRTATRDMSLAFFAGMREIKIFRVKYSAADDTEVYTILRYDNDHFTRSAEVVTDENGFSHTENAGDTGTIESVIFPSASSFQKLTIVPIERGLRSNKGPVSLLQNYDQTGASWEDVYATWEDPLAPWDADIPAARAEFDSNHSFQGQTVVELARTNTYGLAGVIAPPYHLRENAKYRLGFTIYRVNPADNIYRLQLIDGDTGSLIKEFNPNPEVGKWVTVTTPFQTLGSYTYSPSVGAVVGPQNTVWTGSPAFQEFTPSGSPTVHGIRLRTANTGGAGTVTVAITDASNNVLRSGTYSYSNTAGEIDVPLASSLALTAGTVYRVRVTWTGAAAFWTTTNYTNSQLSTSSGIDNNPSNPRMLFTLLGASVVSSATEYPNAVVRLITEGSTPETIYIAGLFLEEATHNYEVSNNGGSSYMDASEAVWNPDSYVNFPTLGNQLRLRITLRNPGDLVGGILMTPVYSS